MRLLSAHTEKKIRTKRYVRTGRHQCKMHLCCKLSICNSHDTHFCRLDSAPQKIALSGRSVMLLLSSGLTTLMYASCPRYQLSRFCTRRFHMPALSRNTRTAVQAPGNTCNHVHELPSSYDKF
jgi:hypothetical protein